MSKKGHNHFIHAFAEFYPTSSVAETLMTKNKSEEVISHLDILFILTLYAT